MCGKDLMKGSIRLAGLDKNSGVNTVVHIGLLEIIVLIMTSFSSIATKLCQGLYVLYLFIIIDK